MDQEVGYWKVEGASYDTRATGSPGEAQGGTFSPVVPLNRAEIGVSRAHIKGNFDGLGWDCVKDFGGEGYLGGKGQRILDGG